MISDCWQARCNKSRAQTHDGSWTIANTRPWAVWPRACTKQATRLIGESLGPPVSTQHTSASQELVRRRELVVQPGQNTALNLELKSNDCRLLCPTNEIYQEHGDETKQKRYESLVECSSQINRHGLNGISL